MIFGIGTDIVEVERIMNMNSLDKFAKKIDVYTINKR